ncbi:hypothetical protein AB1E18_009599 [Capra hircus]
MAAATAQHKRGRRSRVATGLPRTPRLGGTLGAGEGGAARGASPVNLRQFPPGHPALGEARRPAAAAAAAAASFYRQTRLYVCGAGAHAQTPSSLLLLSRPPSRRRRRRRRRCHRLRLLSPAVAPPPPPALGRWSLLSRCRERPGDTAEPEKSTSNNHHSPLLARRPPSAPTHSPAPFADTDQTPPLVPLNGVGCSRCTSPVWPPTPPREESPSPAAPSRPGRGSSGGERTNRLRRTRTKRLAPPPALLSARPAALRGGSGAGPFLPEDVCRAEAPARREENARAPWLPVMERSLGSRCHRRRRAPAVLREDPASLRARPRPVAGLTVPGAPPPEPRRAGPSRGQRFLTEQQQPPRAQGV